MNEADFAEFEMKDLVPWVKEMSSYLREHDVQERPMTISFHHESADDIWKLPTIDTVQWHVYDQRDFASTFGASTIETLAQRHQKPVMVGEFGWIDEFVRRFDNHGIHLHDGLWSSLVGGSLGGAMVWYWDTYVHPNHLQRHFRPLALFWRGERLGRGTRRIELASSHEDLKGWGIGTPARAYVWVKNRHHTLDQYLAYRCELAKQRLRQARGQAAEPVSYPPRIVRGARLSLRGLQGRVGRYRVEWWDPYRGRVLARAVLPARWDGSLTLEVPDVTFDLAAKLIKLEWWEKG